MFPILTYTQQRRIVTLLSVKSPVLLQPLQVLCRLSVRVKSIHTRKLVIL